MWRIIDHTDGSIRGALETEWGPESAGDALERGHLFGAAMDIVHELEHLGFALHRDFDLRPARDRGIEGLVKSGQART